MTVTDINAERKRRLSKDMTELLCPDCGGRFALYQSPEEANNAILWISRIQCLECGAYIDLYDDDEVEFVLE